MQKQFASMVVFLFLIQGLALAISNSNESNLPSKFQMSSKSQVLLEIAEVYSAEGAPLSVYSGQQTSCALLSDRTVQCWGYNADGQSGIGGTSSNVNAPFDVLGFGIGRVAVKVSMGSQSSCVLLDNAEIKCWGYNNYGTVGDGSNTNRLSAVSVNLPNGVTPTDVYTMNAHSCMTTNASGLYCWGLNSYGQLGLGNSTNALVPTGPIQFDTGRSVMQLVGGTLHTCALLDNGSVSCWGDGSLGQHGDGSFADSSSPHSYVELPVGRTAVKLASSYYATCALLDNSSVYCWGDKVLGIGWNGQDPSPRTNTPVSVSNLTSGNAEDLFAGNYAFCVVLDDLDTKCWGRAANGMLGRGSTLGTGNYYDTPESMTTLPYGRSPTHIALAEYHTCVRLDDGSVGCFGSNNDGMLGNNFGTTHGIRATMNFDQQTYIPTRTTSITEGVSVHLSLQADIYESRGENFTISAESPPGLIFNSTNLTLTGISNYTTKQDYQIWINGSGFSITGTYSLAINRDTDGDSLSDLVDDDDDGDGFSDAQDSCVLSFGNSTLDVFGCPDTDGDGYSNQGDSFPFDNTQFTDTDSDGYGDNVSGKLPDACPQVYGTSNRNTEFGCPDSDDDGWADQSDSFDSDSSQWNDSDGDGFGDSLIGFRGDACPNEPGNSTEDRYGCLDSDNDGWSNENDAFPNESSQHNDRDLDGYGDNKTEGAYRPDAFPGDTTQWNDSDNDGYGDNPYGTLGDWFPDDPSRWQDSDRDEVADEDDAFPNDPTQSVDSDGDGFGDNPNGTRADAFPNNASEWYDTDGDGSGDNIDAFPIDGTQWLDADGDGHGDNPSGNQGDMFPNNPNRWRDSDGDGVADEDDTFPNDETQYIDSDEDGYGDNRYGNNPDQFPYETSEWQDTDGDGMGDNQDAFPFDPSQNSDRDGDGFGDNDRGSGADKFPDDSTQWSDIDGDGYGDNPNGTTPDAFIADPTQWSDIDGDGFGDNPTGRLADAFPNDPTQWLDADGDGLGDNPYGNNSDPYPFDFDNDGYNDSIDPLPKLASPGDLDNDGAPDEVDLFPEDFREWSDSDGDGEGDNADTDDDNDGWADTDELRQGTDPTSSASMPVESFEIVVPGTTVGLSAWDLVGIFGGFPLFGWILFGFVTRNSRTYKFEQMLRDSQTRDELEDVARRWEYMLMIRLLGPHQGIRLERLRAELDDKLEHQNQTLSSVDNTGIDQTTMVESTMKPDNVTTSLVSNEPSSQSIPNSSTKPHSTDETGYEWWKGDDGLDWYRIAGSNDEWIKFES